MLIQVILLFGVALLFAFFLKHHGTSRAAAWVKIAFVLAGAFGVFAVLRPDDVSQFAQLVGVGRGTDLLVYVLAVGFAFYTIHTYLRFKEMEGRYARLARAIALQNGRYVGAAPAEGADRDSDDT